MATFNVQPSKYYLRCGLAFVLALCVALLTGCATKRPAADSAGEVSKKAALAATLAGLSNSVNSAEARLVAVTACDYSLQLAGEYRAVWPPFWHNVLVNSRFRQRGLCYQWADDISAKLETLKLQTLQIHRGVSRLETRREHSSVVLTAVGQSFEEGIVLDAWRNSGRLHWCGVKEDKYDWIRVEVIPESERVSRHQANVSQATNQFSTPRRK